MVADIGAVAAVIAIALTLSIGTMILSSATDTAGGCDTLPGAGSAGGGGGGGGNATFTIVNVSTLHPRTCTAPPVNTTTYTFNTTYSLVWKTLNETCVSNGADTGPCDSDRANTILGLTTGGNAFVNLKSSNGCVGRDVDFPGVGTVHIRRSYPNATNLQTEGYCFGRQWEGGTAYYLTTWNVESNVSTTTRTAHTTATPGQSYDCPYYTYRLVNVSSGGGGGSAGSAAAANTWAGACEQAAERARGGYALLGIVVIVAGAAVAVGAARFLGGRSA